MHLRSNCGQVVSSQLWPLSKFSKPATCICYKKQWEFIFKQFFWSLSGKSERTDTNWKEFTISFYSQASPELAETISQILTNHGPLVKARPSAAVVGIPFKRQGSLDAGLPSSLSGQVGEITCKPSPHATVQLNKSRRHLLTNTKFITLCGWHPCMRLLKWKLLYSFFMHNCLSFCITRSNFTVLQVVQVLAERYMYVRSLTWFSDVQLKSFLFPSLIH